MLVVTEAGPRQETGVLPVGYYEPCELAAIEQQNAQTSGGNGDKLIAFASLLSALQMLAVLNVPAGSLLHIRLTTPVASWSSKAGTPIEAVLIAPVIVNGQVVLPLGCVLTGRVNSVTRVGLGIRHERASLGLEFTGITVPGETARALETRVAEIDNSRERVGADGLVHGIRATNSIAYRVSGYIQFGLLCQFHAEVAEWAIKSLAAHLAEPEIDFPAGTELTVSVTAPLATQAGKRPAAGLSETDMEALRNRLASMPFRTTDSMSGLKSDLVNVMFTGSEEEISAAFRAAGWSPAQQNNLHTRIRVVRAASELRGYASPMTPLLLKGEDAAMSWQKGLNDVSKRHHIRIWKVPELWHGEEVWMGAATRDVDYAYLRPGRYFSHRIDPNVDEERDKVAYDLAFTRCAGPVGWMERDDVPRATYNGTGDPVITDARLAVVRLQQCSAGNRQEPARLLTHGNGWHRFLRREILITRNDLLRSNPYWRLSEAGLRTLRFMRHRNPDALFETPLLREPAENGGGRWRGVRGMLAELQ